MNNLNIAGGDVDVYGALDAGSART